MAYFSGILIHETAIKLQYRLLPRLIWNNGTFCCTRDYSRQSPVKNIPGKNSNNVENEAFTLSSRYLEKRQTTKESSISSLEVDFKNYSNLTPCESDSEEEDFMAEVDKFLEMPDKVVKKSSGICQVIPSGHCQQDVEKSAIGLLAVRAYTVMELKKKLQIKKYPIETIEAVITDLQSRGLINDGLYAETYSLSRWSSSSWGPRRIRRALLKKGISESDAEKAIKRVFKNCEDGEDQDSGISLSKLSMDQLCVQASKQWERSRAASPENRKSRIVWWLQYRGFNWSVINIVIKKLESGKFS